MEENKVDKKDIMICRNSNSITMLNTNRGGARLVINDKSQFNKTDDELIEIYFCTNVRKP